MRGLALLSAAAALLLWSILYAGGLGRTPLHTLASLLALGVLLLPAAGTALAVGALRDLFTLPQRLRALPNKAARVAVPARRAGTKRQRPLRRLVGFVGVLWRLRGAVRAPRGAAVGALGLARLARLGSLSFALLLTVAFLLNFVIIGAAAVVGIGWLLREVG